MVEELEAMVEKMAPQEDLGEVQVDQTVLVRAVQEILQVLRPLKAIMEETTE
jgi:hypothetical protein